MKACILCGRAYIKPSYNTTSFHRFPLIPAIREKWLQIIGKTSVSNNVFICSHHFEKTCFYDIIANPRRHRLKPDAIPTLDLDGGEYKKMLDLEDQTISNELCIYNSKIIDEMGNQEESTDFDINEYTATVDKKPENNIMGYMIPGLGVASNLIVIVPNTPKEEVVKIKEEPIEEQNLNNVTTRKDIHYFFTQVPDQKLKDDNYILPPSFVVHGNDNLIGSNFLQNSMQNLNAPAPIQNSSKKTTPNQILSKTTTPIQSLSNTPTPNQTTNTTLVQTSPNTTTLIQTSSNTVTPIQIVSKTTPIETSSNTSTPIQIASKTTSIENSSNTSTPIQTSSNTVTPIQIASKTAPIEIPSNTSTPIQTSSNTVTPIQIASKTTPIEISSNTSTPIQTSSNTVTPIQIASKTTSIENSSNTSTPIQTSSNTVTPIQIASKTTSIEISSNTSTPIQTSSNTVTPIQIASKATPIEISSNTSTPIQTSSNTVTSIQIVSKTTPIDISSNTSTPIQSSSNTVTPIEIPSKTTSIEISSNTSTPIQTLSNTVTPIIQIASKTTPIETSSNTTTPTQSLSKTQTPIQILSNTPTPTQSSSNTLTPSETSSKSIKILSNLSTSFQVLSKNLIVLQKPRPILPKNPNDNTSSLDNSETIEKPPSSNIVVQNSLLVNAVKENETLQKKERKINILRRPRVQVIIQNENVNKKALKEADKNLEVQNDSGHILKEILEGDNTNIINSDDKKSVENVIGEHCYASAMKPIKRKQSEFKKDLTNVKISAKRFHFMDGDKCDYMKRVDFVSDEAFERFLKFKAYQENVFKEKLELVKRKYRCVYNSEDEDANEL